VNLTRYKKMVIKKEEYGLHKVPKQDEDAGNLQFYYMILF